MFYRKVMKLVAVFGSFILGSQFGLFAEAAQTKLTVLASFDGTNGAVPWASLVQGTDGSLYGTAVAGGASSSYARQGSDPAGTVFKLTPDGNLSRLVAFVGVNGSHPRAALVEGADGNFYGTTHEGGANPAYGPFGNSASPGLGTIFRVGTNGSFTTLVSFWGTNGAHPAAGLVNGPDGAMYGMSRMGGSSFGDPLSPNSFGWGEVFKITTNGDFSVVYSFPGLLAPNNPGSPLTPLILGADGNLYGNMFGGNFGFVFRITAQGLATPLTQLNVINGSSHLSALCESRAGGFYGVSHLAGAYQHGGIWRVLPDGTQNTVCSFSSGGALPWGGVVEGTDGNMYGTRSADDQNPNGLIYSVSAQGDYETVASFDGTNGATPLCALIQGKDGDLYGTASAGGAYPGLGSGLGAIFRLHVPAASAPRLQSPVGDGNQLSLKWSAIANRSYQLQCKSALSQGEWNDLGATVLATNNVCVALDAGLTCTQKYYRVLLLPQP